MKRDFCDFKFILEVTFLSIVLMNVESGVSHRIPFRRLKFSLWEKDLALQEKLLKSGIFPQAIRIEGKRIKFELIGELLKEGKLDLELARKVADLLLRGEERLASRGYISEAEIELLELHREHFDAFAGAIMQVLSRNPWGIILQDSEGNVVGVAFSGLIFTQSEFDLPKTSYLMSRATLENAGRRERRNTLVDFWFTGSSYSLAEAAIFASFRVAQAISVLGEEDFDTEYVYAYSNLRGLSKHPEIGPEEYLRRVQITDPEDPEKLYDPAINFHLRHGAKPVLIIENAFPLISFSLAGGKKVGAIGNGYAVIMKYPKEVWKKDSLSKFEQN